MARDTESKGVPENAYKQHHGLATGKPSNTGAGKGATEGTGKEPAPSRW